MRSILIVCLTLFLSSLILSVACEPTSSVDHYAIAKELETKIGPPEDYSRPEYEDIVLELSLSQTGDKTYGEAQSWMKEIRKARQAALFKTNEAPEVQEGGSHPAQNRIARKSKKQKAKGSWTAAGWLPYNDVPVNMLPSSAKSATSSGTRSRRSSAKCNKGPVILYGTSWCGVCKEARQFFRSNGVAFSDKDVEKNASAMAEMQRKLPGATGYPVIDIGGDIMPGFSAASVKSKMCL